MNGSLIAAIIAVLSALNVLAVQLFGFEIFGEGQVETIVNGLAALYLVLYGIWIKVKNREMVAELSEVRADLMRATKR